MTRYFLSALILSGCSTLDPLEKNPFEEEVTCEFTVMAWDFEEDYETTIGNELRVEVIETGDRENVDPGLTEALRLRLTAEHTECKTLKVYLGLEFSVIGETADDPSTSWINDMAFSGVVGISDGEIVTWDTGSSMSGNTWYPFMQWVEVFAGDSVEISYLVDTIGADEGHILWSGVQEDGITLLLDEGLLDLANAPIIAESTITFGQDNE